MQGSFEELNTKLKNTLVLTFLDFKKPILVETDATSVTVKAILLKKKGDGRLLRV